MYRRRNTRTVGDYLGFLFFVIFVGAALVIFWRTNLVNEDGITPIATTIIASAQQESASNSTTVPNNSSFQSNGISSTSLDTFSNSRIQIPAAGINAMIVPVYLDGTSWDVSELGMNVGHLEGTTWMSPAPGNIVLSGHVELSDGRRGIFARLEELNNGDVIILNQANEERRYVVATIEKVEPTDLSPVYPTTEDRLTLITCGDYSFFQDSYQTRVIVVANRIR